VGDAAQVVQKISSHQFQAKIAWYASQPDIFAIKIEAS
jgi:hypothetical protein